MGIGAHRVKEAYDMLLGIAFGPSLLELRHFPLWMVGLGSHFNWI